jgi:hypothetical protein
MKDSFKVIPVIGASIFGLLVSICIEERKQDNQKKVRRERSEKEYMGVAQCEVS